MWEWRAFGPAELLAAPIRVRDEPVVLEERTDLYLLGRAGYHQPGSQARPVFGLKVRSLSLAEKCELKLRHERDDAGVELWEKVLERRLPLDALWFRELARFLGAREGVAAPASSGLPELLHLSSALGLGVPKLVTVRKTIAKAPCPPAYSVEQDELEISVDGSAPRRLRSIAVEAPTRELCRAAGEALSFPRAGAKGVVVAGYPEALATILGEG